ncbi:hypothetical protein SteCoe_18098 [Stentor coeruleus]|uniref:Peroxisomal biogenesis factor 11 n=1 Tax=Stentor coeruleus TaxID=5963 RepID=A0A1R2BXC7_9CILI|nr:hypothetical protein SteCoe_18098 [Stentor coeruleus]
MNLSYAARLSRQIFRLGKSLLEINNIRKLLKKDFLDSFTKTLSILMSISLCARWFFDNLSVLASYKIIDLNHRELTKAATTSWVFALMINFLNILQEMMKSYAREAMLRENSIGKTTRWVVNNLNELSKTRRMLRLEIAKNIGDMVIACNGALIPYRVLGKQFSEKWVGIGGVVSALISVYEIWNDC